MAAARQRILVIRLGALGDLILCFQAFHEIRAAHPKAELALLTMPAFADFARRMPWFDRVLIDPRAPPWRPGGWLGVAHAVRRFGPARVYDLQGKKRQSALFALLGGPFGPEWSGRAPFCSHKRLDPPPAGMHVVDFFAAQLRRAGVPAQPPYDAGWLDAPTDGLAPPSPYAVLVPGCAPERAIKRWPAPHYARLAEALLARGITPVAVGTREDAGAIAAIREICPAVVDLSGRTSLFELAGLMRRAACIIANETGPMHLAVAVGAPTVALIAERVDGWTAPRGPRTRWLPRQPLASLAPEEVVRVLSDLLPQQA